MTVAAHRKWIASTRSNVYAHGIWRCGRPTVVVLVMVAAQIPQVLELGQARLLFGVMGTCACGLVRNILEALKLHDMLSGH